MVTAAKSGERDVQTVPMAISGVSSATLGRLGTQTLGEAAALAPAVTLSQNSGSGQLTIRGIGTNVVNAGSDPSSAMYLDGVYLGRPAMEFVQFLDLDRIEVLRGPQGTLYGRNAVGGAINLISRAPTNEFQASTSITAGNFGAFRANARIGGALKRDRVMGNVAISRTLRDGYVRDLDHPDHPLGGDDVTAARGQLRVVFNRRTDLLLSSDDHTGGAPLTFNKVLVAKPGFPFDNPPGSPRRPGVDARVDSRRAFGRKRAAYDGDHAVHSARQPDGVSQTGLRIPRGCRHHRAQRVDRATARAAASTLRGDHSLVRAAQTVVGRRHVSLR